MIIGHIRKTRSQKMVSEQALRDRQEPDWTVKNASDKFSLTTGFS